MYRSMSNTQKMMSKLPPKLCILPPLYGRPYMAGPIGPALYGRPYMAGPIFQRLRLMPPT